jgi:hypothetical protein
VRFCESFRHNGVHRVIRLTARHLAGLLSILLIVGALSGCSSNVGNIETSQTPPPFYPGTPPPASPGPTPSFGTLWGDWSWDTAYMAVQNDVVSTVEVEVEGKDKTVTIPPGNQSDGICYSDYTIKVVRYLVDPLPYERITLRVIECYIWPDGRKLPPRWIYSLSAGEHAILFLSKQTHELFTLNENEFALAAGPWAVLSIEGGNVSSMREYHGVEEPVDEFIVRLQLYACEDGRSVPKPTDASP